MEPPAAAENGSERHGQHIGELHQRLWTTAGHSQEQLDEIAYLMNIRPRKRFNWKCPIEVMTEVVGMHHAAPASIQ